MDNLLLMTRIAGRAVAFRAVDVSSIIELGDITPVPRAPDFVAGLGALRSRALTVIDSRKALGAWDGETPPDVRAPVVEVDGHSYAVLVDAVEDVVSGVGEPVPGAATLGARWSEASHGMIETSAGPALLMDVSELVRGPVRTAA